jgi:glycosyltransferase involved in cell wall biosynthesis
MKVSVIIRTLNEAKYLSELLGAIAAQETRHEVEAVVIDSGSTDDTLAIAARAKARVTHIEKERFSFGRSLNDGCAFATGEILIFVSGHCVPCTPHWLDALVAPLVSGEAGYSYGGQFGRDTTPFSEHQVFAKYFPPYEASENADYFCNNANAAITRDVWQRFKFNEEITGLEDMELAKRYVEVGGAVCYVPTAGVFHIHNEKWSQIRRRYEREALALQNIAPEINLTPFDSARYFLASIMHDAGQALMQGCLWRTFRSIVRYRSAQYLGGYLGSRPGRSISHRQKQRYFFPGR